MTKPERATSDSGDSWKGTAAVRGIILAAGKGSRMGTDLPKVLHAVRGKPMVVHGVELLESLGVEETVLVVGYRAELVEECFLDWAGRVRFARQSEQRGTGHAVLQAAPLLAGFDGHVFILYGDMPLLDPALLRGLATATLQNGAAGGILTLSMPDPPEWGRIVRGPDGGIRRIVEVRDASPEVAAIREVNVGVYFMQSARLFDALGRISDGNAQHEYYLTDVVEILTRDGHQVTSFPAGSLDAVMGVNHPYQLEYLEKLPDIEYAEQRYELIDAVAAIARQRKPR